jgi:aminoglycoside 6'-N-acetyltransferase
MIRLRRAIPADVPTLQAWDRKPHVMASGGVDEDDPTDWVWEIAIEQPWWELLIAEEAGRPIGVLRIVDPAAEPTHYWGDCPPNLRAIDIWIGEEVDLGRGYGTEMMRLVLAHCFAEPAVTAVLIDPLVSNVRARRFYQRMGFREVGPRRFGEDDCMVYRFERPT